MRIVSTFLVAAAFAAAAACVADTPARPTGPPGTVAANNAGSDAGSNMVCHEVDDTGSLFSHTECESKDDEAARRDNDQRWMKQPTSQPSSAQGGQIGGGPIHH